jgi:hypothetical protein
VTTVHTRPSQQHRQPLRRRTWLMSRRFMGGMRFTLFNAGTERTKCRELLPRTCLDSIDVSS